jgi:predicted YcjX-like family ATPase
MPLLNVVGEGRLVSASLDGARARRLPRFPYLTNIERMSLQDWPGRTTDISEIGVEVRFMPASSVGRLMSEITGSAATVSIRIVDYPGEWLLDLPLLEQSYAQWSRTTMRLLRKGVRAGLAAEFLGFAATHAPQAPASEETAKRAHDLYCALLVKARDQHGLSYLQPGRFLCRGSLGEVPYLWFAPLDVPEEIERFAPDSLGALMAERFEVYKREAVGRFYEDHFRHYSRQIVLVDVLRALLAGRDAFDDTRLALDAILGSFRYGSSAASATGTAASSPSSCSEPTSTGCCLQRPRRTMCRTSSAIIWPRCCATWRRSLRSRSRAAALTWRSWRWRR